MNSPTDRSQSLDFSSGKLTRVARTRAAGRGREYVLLAGTLTVTSVPYLLAIACRPALSLYLIGVLAFLRVWVTFATSAQGQLAHHLRFLLAGSNPLGMTGAGSVLLAAVDAMVDWSEDRDERRRHPLRYWTLLIVKLLITPLGLVLLSGEFLWDLLLLRRSPTLVRMKWQEFFEIAQFHDLICPEKSNDIFYADLAYARYMKNPTLYQWNRMRALVFELQHYRIDVERGTGLASTNLLCQDHVTAYQTLKRLAVEWIEGELAEQFRLAPDQFLVPPSIAQRLLRNARPLGHYLRFRDELLPRQSDDAWRSPDQRELNALINEPVRACLSTTGRSAPRDLTWHVLRLLDADLAEFDDTICAYIGTTELQLLAAAQILTSISAAHATIRYGWTTSFQQRFAEYLSRHYHAIALAEADLILLQPMPTLLRYQGMSYARRNTSDA